MKHSIVIKFVAILLCAAFLLTGAASLVGIAGLASMGLYERTVEDVQREQFYYQAEGWAMAISFYYNSVTLGNCPEELVESYYGDHYIRPIRMDKSMQYEILGTSGNRILYSGPVTGEDWYDYEIPVEHGQYLVLIGPAQMAEPVETVPLQPASGVESTEIEGMEHSVLVDDSFDFGYYDSQKQEYGEYELRFEQAPPYIIRLKMQMPDSYASNAHSWELLELLHSFRNHLFWLAAVSLLLFAVVTVYLCCAAGHRRGSSEIRPGGINRLPLDLYGALACLAVVTLCLAVFEGAEYLARQNLLAAILFTAFCGYIGALVIVGFCFAFAAQVKTPGGFWWRRTLVCGCLLVAAKVWNFALGILRRLAGLLYERGVPLLKRLFTALWKMARFLLERFCDLAKKGWSLFRRGCRWLLDKLIRFLSMLPVTWQWLLTAFFMIFLLLVSVNSYRSGVVLLGVGTTVALVLYGAGAFGTLLESTKRMRQGDLDTKVDDKMLVGSFREFAQELNALADVAVVAAQKQLRSERMKTELITNVSHDIKTPLTSIINYVDLLEKPHTPQEQEQYLEVLHRQSQRLKKLIDDLMEMSKASTGNIAVELSTVDAAEAVNQALGEFSDKLERVPLNPVFKQPAEPVWMRADGRLLWRVLSNLLSNASKYALPGTRLYIDLAQNENRVILSLKNISREALNVDAEELMERFVRGDTSRNTEGSGLGLNIAKSLMELQGGSLDILVDGDLFKVTLNFPGAEHS